MKKRDNIYPTVLFALFALFVTAGGKLFKFAEQEEPAEDVAPQYEHISPYTTLSHYDELFREAADSTGIDWIFLAAVAHTESRFDSTAVSNVGAKGVMQMMPKTLRGLGVPDSLHAANRHNIHASARYLKELFHTFRRVKDPQERENFVLASYNAGYGHIYDAMRIADKYGYNRHVWQNNIDSCLILKGLPEYYNDTTTCRNGAFLDWKQTTSFVRKVKRSKERFTKIQEEYSDSIMEVVANDSLKIIASPLKGME